jgi:predicted Zn-dependent peptidase
LTAPVAVSDPLVAVTRLANGITVATEAMPDIATASLGVWVAAGSRHERADEHGLSHLIEHMAFKGTRRRSARQIAEDIENVGGEINAATSAEFTSYTARVLGENVGLALDVLGDILSESLFDPAELAREKNVILQEYAAVEDSPDDLVTDAFMEVAFSGQPIGRPILGRPETISSFTPGMIQAFTAREYAPDRMVLAATGKVDHAAIVAAADQALGGLSPRAAPSIEPARYTGGERRISRRLEQANVVIGLPGLSFRDPRYFAAQMFAQGLGGGLTSRLWHEVREVRGLAYSIEAFHWPFSDCGLFGIAAATAAENLPDLVEVTTACARGARDGFDAAELARAKAQLKVSLLASLESPGGRIERNARQLLAWGRILPKEEIVARVDGVTIDDVRGAGAALLAGAPSAAAVGPVRRLPPLRRIAAGFAADG